MSNEVYANGQEVSCKAAAGKSIAAFPDVCFTPPLTPATPPGVPIPYPNTGMASDTSGGSKTVQISGKEVMMKDSSYFKTSTGDEAGSAPKKNVITSVIQGKCYYTAWSMDVKIEGENAVRHLDMMTHNHACSPGATPPWVYVDAAAMSDDCKKAVQDKNDCMETHTKNNITQAAREKHKKPGVSAAKAKASAVGDKSLVDWDALLQDENAAPQAAVQRDFCNDPKCKDKLDCALIPYNGFCCPVADKANNIESKTPHHVVQAHCFLEVGGRSEGEGKTYKHVDKYKHTEAPCICLDGGGKVKDHGKVHEIADAAEEKKMKITKEYMQKRDPTKPLMEKGIPKVDREAGTWSFAEANEAGSDAVNQVTGCPKECLKQQSEAAHKNMMGDQIGPTTPLRADPFGSPRTPAGFDPGATPATTTAPS